MTTAVPERPNNYLGILYDRVSRYSANTIGEIEDIVRRAKIDGVIDMTLYGVIQDMVPLHGHQRINIESLDTPHRIRLLRLERRAYIRLTRYLPRTYTHHEFQEPRKRGRIKESSHPRGENGIIRVGEAEYYNQSRAAERLGVHPTSMAGIFGRRELPFMRYGRFILTPVDAVERLRNLKMEDK